MISARNRPEAPISALLRTVLRNYDDLGSLLAEAASHQRHPVGSALIQDAREITDALRASATGDSASWSVIAARLHDTGAAHARSGHTVADILIARRIHRQVVVDYVRKTGDRLASTPEKVLGAVDQVITACNAVSAELISGYRHAESSPLHADHARAVFINELLWGALSAARVEATARQFDVDPDQEYFALRARPNPGRGLDELARSLGFGIGRSNGGGLGAIVDGELVGFLTSQPDATSCGISGLGPARPLGLLHESFRMASRALHTADRRSLTGVCKFGQLGLLPAVLSDEATGEALCRRYLDPLGDSAFATEIVDTLRAFLTHGMQAPRTARALCVHTNTVRYRIAKFEELTGASFRGNRTAAFELLWALEHRAVQNAPPATAAS